MLRIAPFTFTLGNGKSTRLSVTGDFVFMQECSVSELTIEADDKMSVVMEQGSKFKTPKTFSQLRIYNGTGSTATIKILVGVGDFDDGKVRTISDVEKSTQILDEADVAVLTGTLKLLALSSASRRYVIIQNLHISDSLRVGTQFVSASRGHRLSANESIKIESTANVYGFQTSVASLNVSIHSVWD